MSIRTRLEQKLAANNQRHQAAVQDTPLDTGRQHVRVPLEQIQPNRFQPRRQFDEQELATLAESIDSNGLLQPVTLRKLGAQQYELIAGERRWRAHQQLGKPSIEALVVEADDEAMAVLALAENISRAELTDFEIGRALRQIEQHFPTRTRLAEAVGLNREDMYRYFAFEALPITLQQRLEKNPALLARAAANDIKKALGAAPSEVMLARLHEAFDLLQAGQMDQGKIARFIQTEITAPGRQSSQYMLTNAQGKPVGSWSADSRAVRLTLKRQQLEEAQIERLQAFIHDLLKE